jgi:hypothetical protein
MFDGGRLIDSSGNREIGLELGDFNEDGFPDVITANSSGSADLLINRQDNWLFMAPSFPRSVSGNKQAVVTGDFNEDGHLDAAIAGFGPDGIHVLLGDGQGGVISIPTVYPGTNQPFDIATADVNGDHHLDLVTANQSNNVGILGVPSVTVWTGSGDGTFTYAASYPVGASGALTRGLAIGDVTGDGKPDIVVANTNAGEVRILVNNGDGTFTLSPTAYATTAGPRKVVLADFNEDGHLDIATADSGDGVPVAGFNNQTTVLLNDGTGVFTPAAGSPFTTGAAGSAPFALRAADLDGDGHLDLAFVNRRNGTLSVLRGAGDGSFGPYQSVPFPDDYTDAEATDLAVGDFNHDGKPDLVANASGDPGYIVTFLNTSTIDPPNTLNTSPLSPGNTGGIFILGYADAGSTVNVYTTSDCSGSPVGSTTAFVYPGSPGLWSIFTNVAPNSTTTFYATATNVAGWLTSACSTDSATYTYDATPPDAPTISVSPASPSTNTSPALIGSAEPGSTITIYKSTDCSGTAAASGSAGDYASPGISVAVGLPSSTTFTATATDSAGNVSVCSPPVTYAACRSNPVVTTLSDSTGAYPARLRDAVAEACAGDTITFGVSGTIMLDSGNGPIVLARQVSVDGGGAGIAVQGSFSSVFHVVTPANVTLNGLTIQNGQGGIGGGVLVDGGSLAISNSTITNNQGSLGGGLGINAGDVVITGTTISGNTATRGGGIDRAASTGSLLIVNSTISGNSAGSEAGGISNFGPGTLIVNTTVADNRSQPLSTNPSSNAGITSSASDVQLKNTIVAGNTAGSGNVPADITGLFDSPQASSFNLIGAGSNVTGITNGVNGNQMGTPASPIDARLGSLANNGGPTQTHLLLTGSPALDAGDNTGAPATDQRGLPRVLDGPDADTTQTVDIGAVEQFPTIEQIADQAILEDEATTLSPLQIVFNLGDASIGDLPGDFESVTASSSNPALVTNDNLQVTGSGSTRTLSIVTESNASGTANITVTAQKNLNGTPYTATATFKLTVTSVNDPPTLDAITGLVTVAEDSGSHIVPLSGIAAGPGESQTLTVTATSSDPSIVPDPSVTYTSPNATAQLQFTPAADRFGTVTITVTVQDDGGTANGGLDTYTRTFDITVTPVADTPQVSPASPSAFVNTPATIVVSRNAVDGPEVQYFKIANIQNGTVRLSVGSPPLVDPSVVTAAQAAGLLFTPSTDSTATGAFDVSAQLDAAGAGPSGAVTVSIPVSQYSTATAVTASPNPSNSTDPVTVTVTVASTNGGPTPTGTVTVSYSGSSATCAATLSGGTGSCQVSPATPGGINIRGDYSGDAASIGSFGQTFHFIRSCPQNASVLNTDDSGPDSLRQVIADACSTDAITFQFLDSGPHTITLLSPLTISRNLTITGPTDAGVTISGGNATSLFAVNPGAQLTIQNLTLADGASASSGGAISSSGFLTIRNSTLSGNHAASTGGAIQVLDGALNIYNSTLSGNSAPDDGAAIWSATQLQTVNATVTANTGAAAISGSGTAFLITANSIITANPDGDLSVPFTFSLADLGHNIISGDAKLGPLQDNGGPTFTHALLANSPALDAGDNDAALSAGITTDQRGIARPIDGPDVDSIATVDIGAYEARASLAFTDPITLPEDNAGTTVTLHLGALVTSVAASTTVGPLFLAPPDWILLAGSGDTRDLVIPASVANGFGTQTIDIYAYAGSDESLHATLTVNVTPVADTPSITDSFSLEDGQTTGGLVVTKALVDGPEVTHLKIVSVVNGTLFQHDGVTPIAAGAFIPFADGEAGLRFSPTPDFSGFGSVTVQASTSASDAGLGGSAVTANIQVQAVPDAPKVSNVTTLEDTPSGPIYVLPSDADASGPAINVFVITGITGGRVYLPGGVTEVVNGSVITAAQGAAGLVFNPAPNSIAAGHFTAQAGFTGSTLSPTGTTATITITPVADTPSATPATTYVQQQTTSGLRLQRNAVDGAEVTHFRISGLTGGALFLNDGTTPIADGAFITFAQGDAGLKFTPPNGFVGTETFQVQAATDGTGGGLSPAGTASISVVKQLTATTITSHTPNPVDRNSSLAVVFSVASTTGGPAPTGTVTVRLGPKSCTGTIAAGHCVLLPSVGGAGQTLTATYNGDALSQTSTTSVLQDVNACPTPVVTTTADSGPGSLRQAIVDACARSGVEFDIPGPGPQTIVLTSGPIVVDKIIAFFGPLTERVRISGNHASRVFDVTSGGASFVGLEIVDGAADEGAGIRTSGGVSLDGVTLSGNVASVRGGAIVAMSSAPYLEIFASTLSGNSAPAGGAVASDGPLSIVSSTITLNTGGGAAIVNSDPTSTSANSIITGNDGPAVVNTGAGVVADQGGNLLSGDPMLGPLQDNGGPTFTHMPLPGSPAIDGGVNALANDTTDQRGIARIVDGPDLDTTATIDIGAVEVTPSVSAVLSTATPEDTPTTLTFRVGHIAEAFDSIVATSSDQTVVPDTGLVITGSGDTRTLTITPGANRNGTATITVTATAQIYNGATNVTGPLSGTSSFQLTVSPVADTPSITGAATFLNAQTTSGLVITRNAADGAEVTHYRVTGITGGTLFQHDGVTPIANGDFITVAQGVAGLRFTPALDSTATGHVSVQASVGGTVSGLGGGIATADITVSPQRLVTIAVGSSVNPSTLSAAVSITATVKTGGAGTATGTITFAEDSTTLGTVTLSSGAATFTTSAFAIGTHHLAIGYSGDGAFAPASAAFDQVVAGGGRSLITGADAGGGPHVRRFNALDGGTPTAGALDSFFAFNPGFAGGVRVAEGDVNGDGVPDYITGAGPGGAPEVRVFDGATGVQIASIVAFEPAFHGGVFVAAGDVDGDGLADIIVGSDGGRSGEVKVLRPDGTVLRDIFPFGPGFTAGVRVAAGDVNGDGFADLVVGTGPGAPALVKIVSGGDLSELQTISPYPGFPGGVWVAAGDVDGDGLADVITGAGAGGGPHVRVFNGLTGAGVPGFFAFDPSFSGGARVAAGDVNGDGRADIIVAAGPGGSPEIRVFDGSTGVLLSDQMAYSPLFPGGAFVGTAVPVNRMFVDTPAPGTALSGPFTISGWAFEDGGADEGVDAIHVWALPVAAGAPQFLGVATLGVLRPDVAAYYGLPQYQHSGYTLSAPALPPGTYDVVVFVHSRVSGTFNMRRVVRVTF